jgi:hypothetical protein
MVNLSPNNYKLIINKTLIHVEHKRSPNNPRTKTTTKTHQTQKEKKEKTTKSGNTTCSWSSVGVGNFWMDSFTSKKRYGNTAVTPAQNCALCTMTVTSAVAVSVQAGKTSFCLRVVYVTALPHQPGC